MNDNLDILLKNHKNVLEKGKVNVYAVKNHLTREKETYAIALPDGVNKDFLSDACEKLKQFCNADCRNFDAANTECNTYERLELDKIGDKWDNIKKAVDNCKDFKSNENKNLAQKLNLSVVSLNYQDQFFYLCAKQQNCEKLFKGKRSFLSSNDKLESFSPEKLLIINPTIDFIVVNNSEISLVFVFDKSKFESVFQYDDYLKETVMNKLDKVNEWSFLKSVDLIKEKVNQKNVYRNLSKIFDDDEYLCKIKSIDKRTLKNRLLKKGDKFFSSKDFDGDSLLVSASNLEKVMKMLAKGFRYNFFEDKAEQ